MNSSSIFFRPEWTCGRYNKEHRVAIYYNLIAGLCYFFEDDSADVMGEVLNAGKNESFCLENISEVLGIHINSLKPFFEQLESCSLVTKTVPTKEGIAAYRKQLSQYKCNRTQKEERTTQEKLPYEMSNAEMDYTNRVGGITSAMFELTYNCSEKCIHCYNIGATRNDSEQSFRADREELQLEDYKRIIDDLYENGLIKVTLSGGDPFSKPIVWDIIDYLYQKGIATTLFTNGQRIINDVERLADYYPCLIGVSIYSGVEEDHDFITRVPGSWRKSVSVIEQLSALAVPMNIKCCVMRSNVQTYYTVNDLAKKYGAVPQFEIGVSDSVDGDRCVSQNLRLTKEQLEIVLRDDNVPLYVGKEAPNYGGQPKLMDRNCCGGGHNNCCITPEGNVIPCVSFHAKFGSVKENSITEIYKTSKGWKDWNSMTLQQYEECGRHEYCAYCNLCPGHNFAEHGTPLKPSEHCCYFAKVRYELAHIMMEGYDPLQGRTVEEALKALPSDKPKSLQRDKTQSFCDIDLKVGG